jgi:hypothetical protein
MTSWTRSLASSLASSRATWVLAVPAVMLQDGGDLSVGHAEAHQLEHFAFAVGDLGEFPGLVAGAGLVGELPDQAPGDARRDDGVAGRDHADRGQDVVQCHALDQESACSGPQRAVVAWRTSRRLIAWFSSPTGSGTR